MKRLVLKVKTEASEIADFIYSSIIWDTTLSKTFTTVYGKNHLLHALKLLYPRGIMSNLHASNQ